MKKNIIVAFLNVVIFYIIRILIIFVAFVFGIGASASSEKYEIILPLIEILLQLILVFILVAKKKWGLSINHLIISATIVVLLGVLAFFEVIP